MNYFVSGIFSLLLLVMAGCASKPDMTPKVETANPPDTESFSERALKEKISDSLAIRPSWTYYQYALQAMDNQEWLLARHYLDESLRQLISEKFDSTYKNVSAAEDSAYRVKMPLRIVRALDEVYPNVAEMGQSADNYTRNEVSIEGIDAFDESEADSAAYGVAPAGGGPLRVGVRGRNAIHVAAIRSDVHGWRSYGPGSPVHERLGLRLSGDAAPDGERGDAQL